MKVKFSALISDMRGKLNGSVASKNRYGSYFRNKVTPVNRRTSYQTGVRASFASISQAWRSLTAAQRLQWNAAVNNFKLSNIFGDTKILSGANLYSRLNNNLVLINETQISVPPLPTDVPAVTALSLTADVSDNKLEANFSPAIDADVSVVVMATAPQSAGKSFVSSEYRKIDVLISTDASPVDLTTAYVAKFGALGSAGEKIFVKFMPIDENTGIPGAAISASCIITA